MRFATSGRAVLTFGITLAAFGATSAMADGKATYDKVCSVCHASGVANAPKFGDKTAWEPRIKAGSDALVNSVLKGKGTMPPKGGNNALGEADIKAAVEFMVNQAK